MDAELDRLLDPAYPGELAGRDLAEIRAMRAECQEVETGLSLLRRMVQGRLDIVGAELARRAEGGDPGDLSDLVARLPELLSDRTRSSGPGRLPQLLAPAELDPALEAELDAIASAGSLADLPSLPDDELDRIAGALGELEARVSGQRRALFERIDALQGEITRRYRDGEATVQGLLDG
jgi:hypothetical protein